MNVIFADSKRAAGQRAAHDGAALIREALNHQGHPNIILATGASQFEMLDTLAQAADIDWHRVTAFHLDEYAGLPIAHAASFRLYLWQRFISKLPTPLHNFYYINAEDNCQSECIRLGEIIREHPIDVAFVGIGENGHLAFNDPPADFETAEPYILVNLDEACRRQQLDEGWFASLNDVPKQAISMSIQQIMKSRAIICTVPDQRKAKAIKDSLEGPITPAVPASILQKHPRTTIFLDNASASLLSSAKLQA